MSGVQGVTTAPPAPGSASGSTTPEHSAGSGIIAMNESTTQFVARAFAITLCAVMTMVVGVLAYRVAIDGNSQLTNQITNDLAGMVPWLCGSMVAALIGKPLASAVLTRGVASLLNGNNTNGS